MQQEGQPLAALLHFMHQPGRLAGYCFQKEGKKSTATVRISSRPSSMPNDSIHLADPADWRSWCWGR
jgi:hypothetical protein